MADTGVENVAMRDQEQAMPDSTWSGAEKVAAASVAIACGALFCLLLWVFEVSAFLFTATFLTGIVVSIGIVSLLLAVAAWLVMLRRQTTQESHRKWIKLGLLIPVAFTIYFLLALLPLKSGNM